MQIALRLAMFSDEPVNTETFVKLLTFRKKKDLTAYARDAVLVQSDFARIIVACHAQPDEMPWAHRRVTHETTPSHLVHTSKDGEAIAGNGIGPFKSKATRTAVNKIFQLFEERRILVGHIFWNDEEWHFFFFDQRDVEEHDNHWQHGPHIHLVNMLWPRLNRDEVWKAFVDKRETPKNSLYLRYSQPHAETDTGWEPPARQAPPRSL